MNTSGDDYTYDNNGNMTADGNKGINVAYNLLNLPQQVWNGANEKIYYLYDASGRKLSQIVSNAAGAQTKLTDYHGEYIYENDTLRFANHEEGRVIMTGGEPEYQYHLKDHLGNVRMTFTTKDEADSARATLEDNHRTQDSLNFLNYRNARLVYSQIFDKTNGSSPGYAQRLSGAPNERIGLARSFSVMPGDKIKARVYAKYFEAADTTAALQTLFGFFANPAASGGVVIDGGGYSNAEIGSSLPWMGTDPDPDEELPKAYLNYIFINRDYDMNSLAFVAKQISEDALEDGSDGAHELLEFEEIAKEAGYVYVYLSNDGEEVREVYFDDFKVEHIKSPVIESQDYYPFGLTHSAYQREGTLSNLYQYNGKEFQEEMNLAWLDYGARMYMSDIGRFGTMDRFSEKYNALSPFQYGALNPVKYIDVNGDSTYLIVYGAGHLNPDLQGGSHDVGEGFKKNAEARADQIRKTLAQGDDVVMVQTTTEDEYVNALNTQYTSGVVKQLDVYSHGSSNSLSLGGPDSGGPVETAAADADYRLVSAFPSAQNPNGNDETTRIDASNFAPNATVNLWGCNLGGNNTSDITTGVNHAQALANHLGATLGGGVTVNAFNGGGGASFKMQNGKAVYDGTMIRYRDQGTQQVIQTSFKPR